MSRANIPRRRIALLPSHSGTIVRQWRLPKTTLWFPWPNILLSFVHFDDSSILLPPILAYATCPDPLGNPHPSLWLPRDKEEQHDQEEELTSSCIILLSISASIMHHGAAHTNLVAIGFIHKYTSLVYGVVLISSHVCMLGNLQTHAIDTSHSHARTAQHAAKGNRG